MARRKWSELPYALAGYAWISGFVPRSSYADLQLLCRGACNSAGEEFACLFVEAVQKSMSIPRTFFPCLAFGMAVVDHIP